jgi:site-specific DNA recombinase
LVAQFEQFIAETTGGNPQEQAIGRQLQARLDRLARADQRLLEAYQAEVISLEELAERRGAIAEQHHAAVQQRDQHRRTAEQRVHARAVLTNVAAFSGRICSRLKDADFREHQAILQLVVERIIVHGDTLEIRHVIPLRDPGPVDGPTGPATAPDIG